MIIKVALCYFLVFIPILVSGNAYETNIIFRVFRNTNLAQFTSTFSNNATFKANCNVTGNLTIITHGWRESFTTSTWPAALVRNFLIARKGCVLFMDYYYYSNMNYFTLMDNFNGIRAVLTRKLNQLQQLGYKPANIFMFGFSYGAHLVFEGAYKFGNSSVQSVHGCDPAEPGFPSTVDSVKHAMYSGKEVQCIHTSQIAGTSLRYCQKDINMGKCGWSQEATSSQMIYPSHEFCTFFYNNSFAYNFTLVPKTTIEATYGVECKNQTIVPDITTLPPTQMGFRLDMNIPNGEYYALTSKTYPYNVA